MMRRRILLCMGLGVLFTALALCGNALAKETYAVQQDDTIFGIAAKTGITPDALKEANRLNVRDIPIKLAAAGYIMIPARSNEPPFNFPGEPLERLSEAEHKRWMQSKLDDG